MGFDLKPANDNCARMEYNGSPCENSWGRYNITGWVELGTYLDQHGVSSEILPEMNDGEQMTGLDCLRIAEVLDMATGDDSWLQSHANWWRTCGGCWVF
jgi:hypothetical protein